MKRRVQLKHGEKVNNKKQSDQESLAETKDPRNFVWTTVRTRLETKNHPFGTRIQEDSVRTIVWTSLETKNHPFGIRIQGVHFRSPLQACSYLHNESIITLW
jgi:hypothetical protein